MTLKEWNEFLPTLKSWTGRTIQIEYRCNWHRGHAWKKPNKVKVTGDWWTADDGIRFLEMNDERVYETERRNYKSIVSVKPINLWAKK